MVVTGRKVIPDEADNGRTDCSQKHAIPRKGLVFLGVREEAEFISGSLNNPVGQGKRAPLRTQKHFNDGRQRFADGSRTDCGDKVHAQWGGDEPETGKEIVNVGAQSGWGNGHPDNVIQRIDAVLINDAADNANQGDEDDLLNVPM